MDATSSINMVHVDDILEATCQCLQSPAKRGLRLNVAGGNLLPRLCLSALFRTPAAQLLARQLRSFLHASCAPFCTPAGQLLARQLRSFPHAS